jgi:hypothetical protein
MRALSLCTWLPLAAVVPSIWLSGQTPGFRKFVVPDVPDLTIKTRRTIDLPNSTVETDIVFLKHAWQRRERILQFPATVPATSAPSYITITRCDERRTLELNPEARTFASLPIEDLKDHAQRLRAITSGASTAASPRTTPPMSRQPVATSGANVTITIDAVDTGERRRVGRVVARHVITTTTTEAEPGANAQAGESIQDGWYIDLPPANCWDWGEQQPMLMGSFVRVGSLPDRVRIERRGRARVGFPIEEISRTHGDGQHHPTTRVALIEVSEAALDDALFTVPPGYRAALPRLRGGFDLTRPDTFTNRLADYWEEATAWARVFW